MLDVSPQLPIGIWAKKQKVEKNGEMETQKIDSRNLIYVTYIHKTDEYMLIFSTSMHGFAGHHRAEYGPLARSGTLATAMRPYGCNFLRVPAFCR